MGSSALPDLDVIDPARARCSPCRHCLHLVWQLERQLTGVARGRAVFRLVCGNAQCRHVLVEANLPHAAGEPEPQQRWVPARHLPTGRRG